MMKLVAIAALTAAISSAAMAGALPGEAPTLNPRCAAPLSIYQAIAQLGFQVDPHLASPEHPPMTLSPGQMRSLQIED